MVQQLCPNCRADNSLENDYCGHCGSPLQSPLAYRNENSPSLSNRFLAPSLREVGGPVAVSLVALAAEAGLSWLRRRLVQVDKSRSSPPQTTAIIPRESPLRKRSSRTILSQRVVQIWENGQLKGQGVEQSVWQFEE